MSVKRLACILGIILLALGMLSPHFQSQGWTDLAQLGAISAKWLHHWSGTLFLIGVLVWSLHG